MRLFDNYLKYENQDICTMYIHMYLHTVEELKDWTKRSIWSKTTLITRGVGGAGVDPPSWKMDTFFLGSLALSVSIYRNLQSNRANWPSLKLWKKIVISTRNFYVLNMSDRPNQSMIVRDPLWGHFRHFSLETGFSWFFLQILRNSGKPNSIKICWGDNK